jgi:hypothetical protein
LWPFLFSAVTCFLLKTQSKHLFFLSSNSKYPLSIQITLLYARQWFCVYLPRFFKLVRTGTTVEICPLYLALWDVVMFMSDNQSSSRIKTCNLQRNQGENIRAKFKHKSVIVIHPNHWKFGILVYQYLLLSFFRTIYMCTNSTYYMFLKKLITIVTFHPWLFSL